MDDLAKVEKKILIGLTKDAWQVTPQGLYHYKNPSNIEHITNMFNALNVAGVQLPLWSVNPGPDYEIVRKLFNSYWTPQLLKPQNMLFFFDIVVVPDPEIAKYLIESYDEYEEKLFKEYELLQELKEHPAGAIQFFPPLERLKYEMIEMRKKDRWYPKLPPIAVVGFDTFLSLSDFTRIDYASRTIEEFVLHFPIERIAQNKKVLLLRYKNKYEALTNALKLKDLKVTSLSPINWVKLEWSPQEERMAREVDVVYFENTYSVTEWKNRLGDQEKAPVAFCVSEKVAVAARAAGHKEVVYPDMEPHLNSIEKVLEEAIKRVRSPVNSAV